MMKNSDEGCPSAGSSSNASQVSGSSEPPYIYHTVASGNFCVTTHEKVLLASTISQPSEGVAIRIRYGPAGYTEWLAELQVYLLPNFKHQNILEYYGSEVYSNSNAGSRATRMGKYVRFLDNIEGDVEAIEMTPTAGPSRPRQPDVDEDSQRNVINDSKSFKAEYWLTTKFCDSTTLKDYLIANTITWDQMIKITKGIMRGLYFLHENHEYQDFDTDAAIDSFISSTNGALRRVAFGDVFNVIHMKPPLNLTIIHRNLCSKNIIIKRDFTACIWNFGNAYVHHPFQPTNHCQFINPESKRMHLLSHYSPPEVLQERGNMSLAAMKSIDMYSSGIIMWELISRCVLPELNHASEYEQKERLVPDKYYEPLSRELGQYKNNTRFIKGVVCRLRIRPRLKHGWLLGKKTFRYVQTITDLWDHEFEARLHPATVIGRLHKLSLSDRDRRVKQNILVPAYFDPETNYLPIDPALMCFQAPVVTKCKPNIVYDDYTVMPTSRPPYWITEPEALDKL